MRNVPAALKAHLQQSVTTTCRLLKIKLKSGDAYGICSLDWDVEYQGVTYSALNGFNPSAFASDSSFGVDNAEGYALISANVPGITVDMVKRGELDDAQWECYLVNYEDLTQGHLVLDAGDLGEVRVVSDGTVYIPELVSFAMRLRQTIGHVDSKTCRAIFGREAMGQLGCGVKVDGPRVEGSVVTYDSDELFGGDAAVDAPARIRFLTGLNAGLVYSVVDVEASGGVYVIALDGPAQSAINIGDTYEIYQGLWDSAFVSGVYADEPERAFWSLHAVEPPARVQWTSGDNTSQKLYAVENVVADSGYYVVTLFEPAPFAIQDGDGFSIRPDCDKRFETCRDRWNNVLNFKGENLIPLNDGNPNSTPSTIV